MLNGGRPTDYDLSVRRRVDPPPLASTQRAARTVQTDRQTEAAALEQQQRDGQAAAVQRR